jgi:predicted metal-dependent hydrolase
MPRSPEAAANDLPPIPFVLTRSRRRKRTIEIRVDEQGCVRVSAPERTSEKAAREFVERRAAWIRRKQSELAARPAPQPVAAGHSLPFLGRQLTLDVASGRSRTVEVRAGFDSLAVSLPTERAPALQRVLESWYRARAADHLEQRVAHWSREMGLPRPAIQVRAQRRRWGSCSRSGILRFSWRLVMAPPDLVDYVVVHELAHLRHMNHSAAFHAEVARWLPEHRRLAARLRKECAALSFTLGSG